MFFESIKAAWLAGKIRVAPAPGQSEHVIIEAHGTSAFKAAFLSGAERRLLAELARFDPAFVADLPLSVEDWTQAQRNVVTGAIHKYGLPRFPASMAKHQAETLQHRYLA